MVAAERPQDEVLAGNHDRGVVQGGLDEDGTAAGCATLRELVRERGMRAPPPGLHPDPGPVQTRPAGECGGSPDCVPASPRNRLQRGPVAVGQPLPLRGNRFQHDTAGDGGDGRVGADDEPVAGPCDHRRFEAELRQGRLTGRDLRRAEEGQAGHDLHRAEVDTDALAGLQPPPAPGEGVQLDRQHHRGTPVGVGDQHVPRAIRPRRTATPVSASAVRCPATAWSTCAPCT